MDDFRKITKCLEKIKANLDTCNDKTSRIFSLLERLVKAVEAGRIEDASRLAAFTDALAKAVIAYGENTSELAEVISRLSYVIPESGVLH